MFHQKAEHYVDSVPTWSGSIDGTVEKANNPPETSSKDAAIADRNGDIPSLGKILFLNNFMQGFPPISARKINGTVK